MKTIDLLPGTEIEQAARMLVQNAPARAEFNGTPIRARYATTNPRDIVAHYFRSINLRSVTWEHSPAGKKCRAEQTARLVREQATADEQIKALDTLDFSDLGAVLAWVERMESPTDHMGVKYDHAAVVDLFAAHGWMAGVNCNDDFDAEDARNFAGWIVGQWLKCRYPLVSRFAADWRAKFITVTA